MNHIGAGRSMFTECQIYFQNTTVAELSTENLTYQIAKIAEILKNFHLRISIDRMAFILILT